jgi:hypothetical protein
MTLLHRLKAAWTAFVAPRPLPLAMLGETIREDARPQDQQLLNYSTVEPDHQSEPKPKRRSRRRKVIAAAPEPIPSNEEALKRLRERKRPQISNDHEIGNLRPNTAIAIERDRTLYRQPGETLQGFVDRVRSIVADSKIDWREEEPDKTKLDILQDVMNRPLRADGAPDFSQILPEDLSNIVPAHRIVH